MRRTITVYADVQVEVDLRKFSTDVLMEEIKEREEMRVHQKLKEICLANDREIEDAKEQSNGQREEWTRIPPLNSPDQHPLHGIYYALKFGKKDHAVDLMRDYLADQFGVCL